MTGQLDADFSARHAAYDLKKLRGKQLLTKIGRSRRYEVCPSSMRSIAAQHGSCACMTDHCRAIREQGVLGHKLLDADVCWQRVEGVRVTIRAHSSNHIDGFDARPSPSAAYI